MKCKTKMQAIALSKPSTPRHSLVGHLEFFAAARAARLKKYGNAV